MECRGALIPVTGPLLTFPPFLLFWSYFGLFWLRTPGLWALCQPVLWAMQRCTVYGLVWEDVGQNTTCTFRQVVIRVTETYQDSRVFRDLGRARLL